ncbi:hypothetical protein CGC20_14275 [Leishmania donovani]|uniref:Uncharacterized protein n=1 Tax=Leishmania donovani TaxID=5661 RepID=A0A504XG68_LEIDO|nr:hypothetical protein CGC20_14275 [Leishmania donovani]
MNASLYNAEIRCPQRTFACTTAAHLPLWHHNQTLAAQGEPPHSGGMDTGLGRLRAIRLPTVATAALGTKVVSTALLPLALAPPGYFDGSCNVPASVAHGLEHHEALQRPVLRPPECESQRDLYDILARGGREECELISTEGVVQFAGLAEPHTQRVDYSGGEKRASSTLLWARRVKRDISGLFSRRRTQTGPPSQKSMIQRVSYGATLRFFTAVRCQVERTKAEPTSAAPISVPDWCGGTSCGSKPRETSSGVVGMEVWTK